MKINIDIITKNRAKLLLIYIVIALSQACYGNIVIKNVGISLNKIEENDPFVGKFNGTLFGLNVRMIITKISQDKYSVSVNDEAPDEAILTNGQLSGYSDGMPFSLRFSNGKLLLNIFGQDLVFEKEMEASSNYSKHQEDPNYYINSNSSNDYENDPFVGNYDLMVKDKIMLKMSIQKLDKNAYFINSSKFEIGEAYKNGNDLIITDTWVIRKSGNELLSISNGTELLLANRKPFKIIPKDILKIDNRLLGTWRGTLSGSYGGHSTSSEYLIEFKNDESYTEVKNFTSGGYSGSFSNLDDTEKGYYQIIEQTKEGGKIQIFGKELGYLLYNDNKKLLLNGVYYYKQ